MNKVSIRKWGTLIGTGIISLLIGIDFTIVNTSLAAIQSNLQASFAQLEWVVAGFGLTFCTLMTTMGRLGDLIGRRRILYAGTVIFALSSLGAGLSHSAAELIFWRIVQGFGGATILPCGMALISEAFSKQQRGLALGTYSGIVGVGLAAGPPLGGVIVDFLSWGWIFLINLPLIAVGLFICLFCVRESKKKEKIKIDGWGELLLIAALSSLIFALTEGPYQGWSSLPILGSLSLFAITTALLLKLESKKASPILPLTLFAKRGFLLSTLVFLIAVSFTWPILFFAPLYLQNVLGYSPAQTGLLLLPMTLMTVFIPPIAGYLYDRWGAAKIVCVLFVITLATYLLQLFFGLTPLLSLIIPAFILFGSMWGIGNGIGVALSLSDLKSTKDAGIVSGAITTLKNIFVLIALSLAGMLFHYRESDLLSHQAPPREAFLSGYHAVVWFLLILTLLIACATYALFRRR